MKQEVSPSQSLHWQLRRQLSTISGTVLHFTRHQNENDLSASTTHPADICSCHFWHGDELAGSVTS